MPKTQIAIYQWLPEGELDRWIREFPQCEIFDGNQNPSHSASISYGLPDLVHLPSMSSIRWIQLGSAGVPAVLCPLALEKKLTVTNLAGLYGPTIAEHALGLMLMVSRNLQAVVRQQLEKNWDRKVSYTMRDLQGKTIAIVGLGNIGQNIARLCKAMGMRVVGCRRSLQPTPYVDRVVTPDQVSLLFAEADYVAVAAPLVKETEGMLGAAEFRAMKPGSIYINVSRGPVAQEPALIEALQSGRLAGAGLDVFAVEPLPQENPLWSMPNVVISPHYSGETVNLGRLPAERFTRNLRNWLANQPLEGIVRLELGY